MSSAARAEQVAETVALAGGAGEEAGAREHAAIPRRATEILLMAGEEGYHAAQ
jgi:hypothetical protein